MPPTLVRRVLEDNSFFRMLQRVPNQLTWIEIAPGAPFQLGESVACTPLALPGSVPFYARDIGPKGNMQGEHRPCCLNPTVYASPTRHLSRKSPRSLLASLRKLRRDPG